MYSSSSIIHVMRTRLKCTTAAAVAYTEKMCYCSSTECSKTAVVWLFLKYANTHRHKIITNSVLLYLFLSLLDPSLLIAPQYSYVLQRIRRNRQ